MEKSISTKTKSTRQRFNKVTTLLVILVLFLVAGLGYMFWKNNQLQKPEAQTKLAEAASQSMVDKVSKLMVVPDDKPTVATITDVEKLQQANKEFYKNAQNGDALIIYSTQAIIYRNSENKIVNVAPVIVTPDNSTNSSNNTTINDTNETTNTANDTEAINDINNPGETENTTY